jgi:enediyne biosynthesis protein E4
MGMHEETRNRFYAVFTALLMVGLLPVYTMAGPSGTDATGNMPTDTSSRALPTFTNVSDTVGLTGLSGTFFDWIDFNNDGNLDFMLDGHYLFQNNGPPTYTFSDVTHSKGLDGAWGRCSWADYDNDGYKDFYDTDWTDKLFHNNGPPNYDFVDVTVAAGHVNDTFPGTAAAWGDYNNDGFLDLYVVNGEVWDPYQHYPDTFWKNDGDGTFTNLTKAAGLDESKKPYYGRGATWADYDNDGWQDLYISNYRLQPNYLYHNNGNGTFTNVGKETGAEGHGKNDKGIPGTTYYGHTIGSSWADFNNDGWLDIFVANLAHKDNLYNANAGMSYRGRKCDNSEVLINNGFPYWNFTDIRAKSGIPIKPLNGTTNGGWYDDENWANAAVADFDNDGYLDVYIPQVYNFSWMYSYLYHNEGDLTFKNVSTQMGMDNVVDTYGGAWADYNNDGFMDLITAGRQNQWSKTEVTNPARVRLYENNGNSNHWLEVKLTGVTSNKDGVGAKLTAKAGPKTIVRQVESGMGSHGQQNDMRVNLGLGTATKVDTLEIRWPSGIIQVLKDITADQQVNITEDTSGPKITTVSANPATAYPDSQITLSATVTGTIATYNWDYEGDLVYDVVANANNVQTYIARGTYEYHPALKVLNAAGTLGFFMSTKFTMVNKDPIAYLGVDAQVLEDQNVTFDAAGTSDTLWDRANLTFQYYFGDGTNTSVIKNESATHIYPEAGNFSAMLVVTDQYGATNSTFSKVQVLNVPPTVQIVANYTVAQDSVLKLDAIGNDTPTDLAKGLFYRWNFGDNSTKTAWSMDPKTSHIYTRAGLYNVSISIRDDDTWYGSDNLTIVVYDVSPTVQVPVKTVSANEDELIVFTGAGNDTVSDTKAGLKYMWDWGDNNVSEWSSDPSAGYAYPRNGTYTARLIVMDQDGLKANDTVTVLVSNLPPTAEIIDVPTDLPEDRSADFNGKGTDTASDQLMLSYKWDFGDNSSSGWNFLPSAKHTYNRSGDMPVVFYVKDDNGVISFVEASIKVTDPAPIATILKPEKTTFDEDILVTFEGNATDNPSDLGRFNFTWTIDGKNYYERTVELAFTKKGSYEATFVAKDDEGAQDKEVIDIVVNNVQPKVTVTASAISVNNGQILTFNAVATDTASDLSVLKYAWDCGAGNTDQGSTKANATCIFNTPGQNTVKVIVTDDEGGSVTGSVKVTVVAKSSHGDGGSGLSTAMIAGIFAVVIVVVLFVVFLLMRKKGDATVSKKAKHLEDDEVKPKAAKTKKVKVTKADKKGPEPVKTDPEKTKPEEKPADKNEEE